MIVDTQQISMKDTIVVGDPKAPVTIYEYINLRCPDSRNYEIERTPLLKDWIEAGQVKRVLKHCDFDRGVLRLGGVLNRYLPYGDDAKAYAWVHHFAKHFEEWRPFETADAIQTLAEAQGLSEQAGADERHARVLAEAEQLGITKIPTVIVGDTVFEEEVDEAALKKAIADELKSHNIEL